MSIPDEIHQIQTVPEDIPEVPSPAEPTVNENTTKTSRHKKNDHGLLKPVFCYIEICFITNLICYNSIK